MNNETIEETIKNTAHACAIDAVDQGATATHLSLGWGLSDGDVSAIIEAVGRDLTASEWDVARAAFERGVREPTEATDDMATSFFNYPSEIDSDGDIWIERDGNGHWATDEQKVAFAEWLKAR